MVQHRVPFGEKRRFFSAERNKSSVHVYCISADFPIRFAWVHSSVMRKCWACKDSMLKLDADWPNKQPLEVGTQTRSTRRRQSAKTADNPQISAVTIHGVGRIIFPLQLHLSRNDNNKVNYRKQIARQHLCHQNFDQGRERDRPVKIFSSRLIIIQNLVASVTNGDFSRISQIFPTRVFIVPSEVVPLAIGYWRLDSKH